MKGEWLETRQLQDIRKLSVDQKVTRRHGPLGTRVAKTLSRDTRL